MAPDLHSYDRIVVAFSGGKDSLACVLDLIDRGAPRDRIELWHHDVDGREGERLMDWPVTADYCRKVAAALGLPIFFSWRAGGFEAEMLRDNQPSRPIMFERPDAGGTIIAQARQRPTNGTRGQFPQVSPDLSVRWCSPYLKIDVARRVLANDPRFTGARVLFVTGERGEESANRARYNVFEPHLADRRDGVRVKRHIDAWRPILHWTATQVWAIIEAHRIHAHPCYYLGIGRASCAFCIFANPNQLAIARAVLPVQFGRVRGHEVRSGKTVHRAENLEERAQRGAVGDLDPYYVRLARSESYDAPVFLNQWTMPAGAFAETHGPS